MCLRSRTSLAGLDRRSEIEIGCDIAHAFDDVGGVDGGNELPVLVMGEVDERTARGEAATAIDGVDKEGSFLRRNQSNKNSQNEEFCHFLVR